MLYVYDGEGEAPLYPDGSKFIPESVLQKLTVQAVKKLVNLPADISTIPASTIPIVAGKDGKSYTQFSFEIRVTFASAHTDYSLWHKDECYGAVEAEYA